MFRHKPKLHGYAPLCQSFHAPKPYAFEIAERIEDKNEDEHSVAMSVIDAAESGNPDDIKGLIHDIVTQLFDDAGVAYARISKRGETYSIADEAYHEFASWFDYPWD